MIWRQRLGLFSMLAFPMLNGGVGLQYYKVVRLAVAGLLVSFLYACTNVPVLEPDFTLNFQYDEPYLIDVAALEIVDQYKSPFSDPYVEHLSPITPAQAVREWVGVRFRPVGAEGRLRVTVTNASIVGKSLDTDKDFKALFISEQGAELTGTLSVTIEVLTAQEVSLAHVLAYSAASKTLAEDASLMDRDYAMFSVTKSLVKAFDVEVSRQIDQYLQLFLR